jgi:hypothetical protein
MRTVIVSVLLLVSLAGCQTTPQKSDKPSDSASAGKGNLIETNSKGINGTQSLPAGGVNHIDVDGSLTAKDPAFRDYFRNMADIVNDHWQELLKSQTWDVSGKVVLSFRLHSDGTISDIKIKHNEVSDLLGNICVAALFVRWDFPIWTPEMRVARPDGFANLEFTFYYEGY